MISKQILRHTFLLLLITQLFAFSFTANAQQNNVTFNYTPELYLNVGDTAIISIYVSCPDSITNPIVSFGNLDVTTTKPVKVTVSGGTYDSVTNQWYLPSRNSGSHLEFKFVALKTTSYGFEIEMRSDDLVPVPNSPGQYTDIHSSGGLVGLYIENFKAGKKGDIAIENTVSNIKIINGTDYTYTIDVENKGDSIAPQIKVNALLPSELTYISSTTTKGSYYDNLGIWQSGMLAPHTKRTLTITAKLNQPKAVQFCANVTTAEKDIDLSNNYSCANLGIKNIPNPYPGTISGKVVLDVDSNCVTGLKDIAQQNEFILLTDSTNTTYYTVTDSLGNYSTDVPYGKYSIKTATSTNKASTCPVGGILNCNINSANNTYTGANFYQNYVPLITDLVVSQASNTFRPGFNSSASVYCFNKGTSTVNTTLQYVKDSSVTFVSAAPQPSSTKGDTLIFDISNFRPDSAVHFDIVFNTPQGTQLGGGFRFIANLLATNDVTPENNVDTLTKIVVGSYDPNEITVNQGRYIDGSNDELIYRIDFQNTGTYYAQNVLVVDSIEHNLDVSSIHLLAQSHPGLQLSLNPEKNKLDFAFDNILLPDSNMDEKGSHGYVIYSIKMKHGLSVGTTIKNKGYIYFDFNDAIITNQVENTIVSESTGINTIQNSKSDVNVFPNPVTSGYLTLDSKDVVINAELYNVIGEKVLESRIKHIDVSTLPKGLYLLKINTKNSQAVKKIVVE